MFVFVPKNRLLFVTSFLFLIPLVLAAGVRNDVALACAACLVTSLLNHAFQTPVLRAVDMGVVNSIAAFYTLHAVWCAVSTGSLSFVVVPAAAAVALGLFVLVNRCVVPDDCHAFVHLVAVFGICAYVLCCEA